jgi:hypothetical protein
VFIVLRKRDLQFLHWYHHVTVLIFCWNSFVTESAAGLWFIAMNYTVHLFTFFLTEFSLIILIFSCAKFQVHAVMYLYFGLQTLRLMPKWFPAGIVTSMQVHCQLQPFFCFLQNLLQVSIFTFVSLYSDSANGDWHGYRRRLSVLQARRRTGLL